MDEKYENIGVMFYTLMKLFVAILKFALVYIALKIIIFFVMVSLTFTAPTRVVKLLSTAVTRLLFCLGLFALVKVCLHWNNTGVSKFKKTIFSSFSRLL